MKNHSVYLFVLLAFLTNGCDNPSDQKQPVQNPLEMIETHKVVKKELKKQPVVYKRANVLKKKLFKPKPIIEDIQNPIEAINIQRPLDLSIPVEFKEKIIPDSVLSNNQPKYLPDFFVKKKEKSERKVQIDGKVIVKEEAEFEKQTAIDGVGIAIKITH